MAIREEKEKQRQKEFLAEAGLDPDGNVIEFQCPECTQRFGTEHALNLHIKYTHSPKEEVDPTAELIKKFSSMRELKYQTRF